jgi:hypothetical protein
MNLQQHVPAKSIREFLRGELSKPEKDLVGLHLSYCLVCRQERNEVLLDEANLELCGMANKSLTEASAHIDPIVFTKFWKGQITDPHRLEEISEHCLICETCRLKRHELWRHNRRGVEMQRYLTATLGVFAAIVTVARRRSHVVLAPVALAVLTFSVLILLVGGDAFLPNSLSMASRSDDIPPIDLINLPRVPAMRNSPTAVVYKINNATRFGELRVIKPPSTKESTSTSPLRTSAGKKSDKLWEELARVQLIRLHNPAHNESYRGADTDENQEKRPLPVVISRTESTGIHIQLPEYSKQGRYLISLHETGQMDKRLADDETETADGKELAVTLDLTKVIPGEYVLLVERETEGSDARELLGFFSVLLIEPANSSMEGR